MRTVISIIAAISIVFVAVVGFYWMREGSLEGAGREVDQQVEALDRSTDTLQDEVGDVGEAAVETVKQATDGDDRT